MEKNRKENDLRPDRIELIMGNTHRCGKCSRPIDLTMNSAKEARGQCPDCGSRDFIVLEGLEECLLKP